MSVPLLLLGADAFLTRVMGICLLHESSRYILHSTLVNSQRLLLGLWDVENDSSLFVHSVKNSLIFPSDDFLLFFSFSFCRLPVAFRLTSLSDELEQQSFLFAFSTC